MLLCKRPTKPDGFDDAVKDAKKKIQGIIDAGNKPKAIDFDRAWDTFTDHFCKRQHVRCGYCDGVTSECPGDLDHFCPKTKVTELWENRERWGHEIKGTVRVKRHQPDREAESGYWWLAYEWDNYVYACERCNRQWKSSLFPLLEGMARAWPPQKTGRDETPLLLHCYGTENPSNHLKFNPDGSVETIPGSRHGWETVKTCGLDRQTLRVRRAPTIRLVLYLIDRLADPDVMRMKRQEALRDLLALGADDRDFAGVVRIIAEQELDQPWAELPKFVQ